MPRARTVHALVLLVGLSILLPASALAQPPGFTIVVRDEGFPTNLAFAPDGRVFFTERVSGAVRILRDGRLLQEPFFTVRVDTKVNETGLLGIAVNPDFTEDPWVYLYYSDPSLGRNRLIRVRADGDHGADEQVLLEAISTAAGWHNGGDMAFGADGKLYLVTGDGHDAAMAQDPTSLGGKILRLNPDGTIPGDGPLPGSPVYALGIRNSFGICFDPESGALWETENGTTEWDEVNRIEPGANHGWPEQLGPGGDPSFAQPVLAYEREIVPTGCAVADGALWFGDYGGNLHRATFPASSDEGTPRDEVVAVFDHGITDVARAPDGSLWVATDQAIYRSDPGFSPSPTPARSASPSPTSGGNGFPGVAGIVVLALLIGALVLVRSRLNRRS
ncbi:MAG TPA: PQQ-dependent sugar dehydrogenase [Actinomycetota bacterium]